MKVLVFVDYYLPGFKGGGPVHSVSRLIETLSSEMDFFVFTRDRDLGDAEPYSTVTVGDWAKHQGIATFYAEPEQTNSRTILAAIRDVHPDVIYLNSYFSKFTRAVLMLRARGKLPGIAVVVAPRGEFSPGALKLKAAKKKIYLNVARVAGLHDGLTWHLSSDRELSDARAALSCEPHSFIKPPDLAVIETELPDRLKTSGSASFAFISRIGPKKNLLGAIEMLRKVRGQVSFTIYGPIEDAAYWSQCEAAMASLPANVECIHAGAIVPAEVVERLSEHHFFLFPTLGENFGHVIAEALGAGCPALLSDQTPWTYIEAKHCGWTIPLADAEGWQRALEECVSMTNDEFTMMSEAARTYVQELANQESGAQRSKQMFELALAHERAA